MRVRREIGVDAVNKLRAAIGVTESVARTMLSVHANIILNDGTLLRTCEHGVRHCVGSLSGLRRDRHGVNSGTVYSVCCESACCAAWNNP